MSESEPLQRWHVAAIVTTVVMTLALGSFAYTLRADVNNLQEHSVTKDELAIAVNDLRNGQERILGVLCDYDVHADKRACK